MLMRLVIIAHLSTSFYFTRILWTYNIFYSLYIVTIQYLRKKTKAALIIV